MPARTCSTARAATTSLHGRERRGHVRLHHRARARAMSIMIRDFSAADDTILLDNAACSPALAAGRARTASAFVDRHAPPQDADDRIIYDQATGQLFFDADGNGAGAQIQFARLDGAPAIAGERLHRDLNGKEDACRSKLLRFGQTRRPSSLRSRRASGRSARRGRPSAPRPRRRAGSGRGHSEGGWRRRRGAPRRRAPGRNRDGSTSRFLILWNWLRHRQSRPDFATKASFLRTAEPRASSARPRDSFRPSSASSRSRSGSAPASKRQLIQPERPRP